MKKLNIKKNLKKIAIPVVSKIARGFIRDKKQIILMVDGGFASQINKYLIGQYLEKNMNLTVKYDISWFEEFGKSIDNKSNRNFELLNIFPGLNFPIATSKEIKVFKSFFYYENSNPFIYNKKIIRLKPPLYIDGYFNHWKYLKSVEQIAQQNLIIKLKLSEKNQQILKKIQTNNYSVALHVRRGDYVGSCHDVLTKEYYINAINYIKEQLSPHIPTFYIFSNGFEWVQKEILPTINSNTSYECIINNSNDSGYCDFYLITQCKHQITSNSYFSYLSSYLNNSINKIVITPEKWINDNQNSIQNDCAHYPEWTVMTNDGRVVK